MKLATFLALVVGLVIAVSHVPAAAQEAESENEIEVEFRRPLRFGEVATRGTSGTVIIDAATGAKSVTGGAIDLGRTTRSARFRIEGDENQIVVVTLPQTVHLTSSGQTVTLSNFTIRPGTIVDLGRRGRANVDIGATMSLPANAPAGQYQGTFTIHVDPQ